MSEKNTGTVKFFNEEKGFGFITDAGNGRDVFVHLSGIIQHITTGDRVEFEVEESPKGPKAVKVKKL